MVTPAALRSTIAARLAAVEERLQAVCRRATEIAGRFEHLPDGKFALACIDDFLLTRTPVDRAPALVPTDNTAAV